VASWSSVRAPDAPPVESGRSGSDDREMVVLGITTMLTVPFPVDTRPAGAQWRRFGSKGAPLRRCLHE